MCKSKRFSHNFCKDPLKLEVKDGWISAEGTTLGGDDGIAVALCSGFFLTEIILDPALEVLDYNSGRTWYGRCSCSDRGKFKRKISF